MKMATEDATRLNNNSDVFKLSALAGDAEYSLQGQMLIGRELDCEIVLDYGHISRYHAKVNVSPGGVYIEDLQSTNGTFVNGKKIRGRVRLSPGDQVAFDDLAFRLESKNSDEQRQPPIGNRFATELRPTKPLASIESIARHMKKPPAPPVHEVRPVEPRVERLTPSLPAEEPSPDSTQIMSTELLERLMSRSHADQAVLDLGNGPRLIVSTAPLRGKVFEFHGAQIGVEWRLGRDPDADMCLMDSTVSLDHAVITLIPEGYRIDATNAVNHLLVNGEECTSAVLTHDDRLQIGRMELVFRTNYPREEKMIQVKEEIRSRRRLRVMASTLALVMLACLAGLYLISQSGEELPLTESLQFLR